MTHWLLYKMHGRENTVSYEDGTDYEKESKSIY